MPRQKQRRSSPPKAAVPSVAERPRSHALAALALILLTTCVVYFPALNGGRIWDDDDNLTKPELQSINGLYRIWFDPSSTAQYYPLVHTAFWIEHKLWGNTFAGYHLINLFWHALSVILLYRVLQKLRVPGALLAAALFAVHPVMVESVAWMCEQKNTLSTVFYLSAVLAYLAFDESQGRFYYALALALYVLALLTKTATVTLPATLLVVLWWQRGTLSWRRHVLPLVPFFMVGAAAGLMTSWVERKVIGAEGSEFELTLVQGFLLAGRAIWFYLSKLAWPTNLTFTYPRWAIDPSHWWQWIFPASALAATLSLWLIRTRWRGPLAAWLIFCGTLFPVLGFMNVYMFRFTFVADHLQYLASLSIFSLAAAGIALGLARLPAAARRWGSALCILLVGTLAILAWQQAHMYADVITLYQATIDRNPDSWMAHYNIAWELSESGRNQEAIDHYQAVINLRPTDAEAHEHLGRVYLNIGRLPDAIKEFQTSLTLKPDNVFALNYLGITLDHQGRYPEAIEILERLIRIQPDFSDAHQNLGNALMHAGRLPEAVEQIKYALQLKPDDPEAQNNMGVVLVQSDKIPQAIEHFRRAIELKPKDPKAHANLGKTLANTGDYQEATVQLQQSLQLQPNRADLQNLLGGILGKNGQTNEAIEHFQTALRLDPNLAETYINLALAFALANRSEEAIAIAQRGIEVARSTGQR